MLPFREHDEGLSGRVRLGERPSSLGPGRDPRARESRGVRPRQERRRPSRRRPPAAPPAAASPADPARPAAGLPDSGSLRPTVDLPGSSRGRSRPPAGSSPACSGARSSLRHAGAARAALRRRSRSCSCRWTRRSGSPGRPACCRPRASRSSHFVPIEDRWRIGYPRLGPLRQGPPDHRRLSLHARPLVRPVQPERPQGRLSDHRPAHLPRHHGVGHSRFEESARSRRQTTPFESTARPFEENFFGRPNQFFTPNFFSLVVRPVPRRRRVQAGRLADQADADLQRQQPLVQRAGAVVSPNVLQGTTRTRDVLGAPGGVRRDQAGRH